MSQPIKIYRTSTPNAPPGPLGDGELCVEMATPCRLWVGVPTALDATGRKLLSDRAGDKAYVDTGLALKADITYVDNGNTAQDAANDAKFVELAGDTMTGFLTLSAAPTLPLHAATKQYVDGATGGAAYVLKAGDTMTGPLFINDLTASTTPATGALTVAGGLGVGGAGNFGGPVTITTTAGPPLIATNPAGGVGVVLNAANAAGAQCNIDGAKGGAIRWTLALGNTTPETGGNTGSDFGITRFDDAGVNLDVPFSVARATGDVSIFTTTASTSSTTGALTVAGGLGVGGNVNAGGNMSVGGIWRSASYIGKSQVFFDAGTGAGLELIGTTTGTAGGLVGFVNANSTLLGSISIVGAAPGTGVAYNVTSDIRLKEDLRDFTAAGGIIDQLKIWDFRWKSTGERGIGVVAQQAAEVYPDAISIGQGETPWGADYSKFVPLLIAEIQSLRKRVAELETRKE